MLDHEASKLPLLEIIRKLRKISRFKLIGLIGLFIEIVLNILRLQY